MRLEVRSAPANASQWIPYRVPLSAGRALAENPHRVERLSSQYEAAFREKDVDAELLPDPPMI
jgi:hypothetical protein